MRSAGLVGRGGPSPPGLDRGLTVRPPTGPARRLAIAHLVFAPQLVIYVGLFVLGLRLSIVSPIVGIPFTLGVVMLVGAWVRAGMAVARDARAGKSPEELAIEVGDAAVEPLALYGILVLRVPNGHRTHRLRRR